MTEPALLEEPAVPAAVEAPPRAVRVTDGAWVSGVCAGIAEHLGWPVLTVRLVFIVLGLAQSLGVVLYLALWLLMPAAGAQAQSPGLESASRTGMRDATVPAKRRLADAGGVAALALLTLGLLWLMRQSGMGLSDKVFWPLAFAAAGLGLVWRQADSAPLEARPGPRRWYAPLLARQGWAAVTRVLVGLGLVGAAVALVVATTAGVAQLPLTFFVVALAFVGLGLVAAPWVHRVRLQLNAAREEKLLADARADMAAHLHDSVLQTLALIQRQADDPRTVASLARRQERELRTWLYGEQTDESTLKAALTRAAVEVEDERGVPVEVVVVGDAELSDPGHALVRAAREAMMNAAKHSGADVIDVYAEAFDGEIAVFVRDRGVGFDPARIDDDRMGVRRSIIDRMERHGGRAVIRSAPGEGTEVRLEVGQQ